jgi:hypothetical protein
MPDLRIQLSNIKPQKKKECKEGSKINPTILRAESCKYVAC